MTNFWNTIKRAFRAVKQAIGPIIHQLGRILGPYWHAFWHWLKHFWHRFQIWRWLLLMFLILFFVVSAYLTYLAKTADVGNLKANLQATTTIYDQNNQKAGSLYSQKGTYVSYDKISPQIQNAVISTEDRSFWTNPGFSIKGMARAAISYVIHHGAIMGGGSTLTQQLAKNALLTQKQTFSRKAEELFLAIEINKVYTKKDILTMYLNNAYFGNGVWGVHDASEKYFGQTAQNIDSAQAASIAAMLRSPSFYNPIDHPQNNIDRRNLILGLMETNKKLTAGQVKTAKQEPLNLQDRYEQADGYKYPYYFDAVVDEAINKYGISEEDIMNKGYKIYTALNQTYQSKMEQSFKDDSIFPANASDGTKVQGGSVAIDPRTGGVNAVVGGRGEHVFRGYNRATQIKRQPGSTMKPLAVYTPALENGYHYDSSLTDKKLSYGSNHYTPTDYGNNYSGKIPMYTALAQSLNAPAVWLLDQIGVQKGVDSVENFGINLPKSDQNLALALGGLKVGVSPYQMASAYTAFANNGKRASSHFITKIVDASGNVVVDNTDVKTKQVMSTKVANQMTSMLMGVFDHGTGQSAKPAGYQVAGKTGSTEVPNSYGFGTKDQWVVGYTPNIVVATWIGFDNTDSSHFLQGISEEGVAPVWKSEMTNILPNTPQTAFKVQDAQQMASDEKSSNSNSTWWNKVQDGVNQAKNNLDSAKDKANSWVDTVKGLFN
ncbi:PBP1A family penicillin-binding protein [Loigolactobacillus backii]|uniref:Carboxypeptidase n=1 Tax=Loigolactobacillus backii TaxID=375175 RepID=A0A192H3Z6_9LACO|nr:PBP1A family penicillin-binding protein [Loigolactobacillus backii]ANK59278.1 carboxypeptidase [Loigolactobacillus backii]ANK62691.1 carboxypeptidase [Loigolactobacillus backii]ANK64270.1 carboxypeptidase [Loigolactobacillus backii]ANK67336.1 carboxypeptidase [Loigolactobacillus backii]ANK70301.1 carboxypeptidase [Loigolactobacillus backii]